MWSTDFLLFLSILSSSDAVIIPGVATVFEGDSQVFSCHKNGYSTSDIQIQFRPAGSNDTILIYCQSHNGLNPSQVAHYRVEKNDAHRTYDLTVRNVSSDRAGKYLCHWGEKSDEAELIVLTTAIPTCFSTTLNNAIKTNPHNWESEIRFECNVRFHGNLLPSVEFWINTNIGALGPFDGSSQRIFNTSRTVLVQHISSNSSDIHYACRLRNINKGMIVQSDCGFQNNYTESPCLVTYAIPYLGKASMYATAQPGVTSHSACQNLCSENPTCVSYQIDNNPERGAYCWLQHDQSNIQNTLPIRQNVSEYVKSNSCRSDFDLKHEVTCRNFPMLAAAISILYWPCTVIIVSIFLYDLIRSIRKSRRTRVLAEEAQA